MASPRTPVAPLRRPAKPRVGPGSPAIAPSWWLNAPREHFTDVARQHATQTQNPAPFTFLPRSTWHE